MKINNYKEALEYIHSVSWKGSRPGLDRIRQLCDALGNPENKIKTLHIAGTNGKGSVSAMLSAVLCDIGYKVGLFTSPYLENFTERFRINGLDIPKERLAKITEKISAFADKMKDSPTEFELITAIAFQYFYEEKCDFAIIETGMGGKLDSTNIIKNPLISIITSISYDHTDYLGNDIKSIAAEKAGIIKKGAPVLYLPGDPDSDSIIIEKAKKEGSAANAADIDGIKNLVLSTDGVKFDYREYKNIHLPFIGAYQAQNCAISLDALEILFENGYISKELFDRKKIKESLSEVKWYGRLEIISRDPFIILDCSHNKDGLGKTLDTLKELFYNEKFSVICGVMKDKDYGEMARMISGFADKIYTIKPNNVRALDAEVFAETFRSYGACAEGCEIADAVNKAILNGGIILYTGSFYAYSDVKKEFLSVIKS